LAQKLYEGGYITYHRTDSVAISDDAQAASREMIKRMFGPEYCPAKAPVYKSSGNAQEAHECIRPTQIEHQQLQGVSAEEQKLYRLIWDQFVSSQMSTGEDAVTVVEIAVGEGVFEARGRMEIFDGFRKLNRTEVQEKSQKKRDEEDQEKQKLPKLETADLLSCEKLESKEVKTRPPARYSEASLIKKLEKEGIGRPSTYASIVATIVKRAYVELTARKYYATDLGKEVTDFLVGRFPKVLDLGFTKTCEDRLDKIALGEIGYQDFLLKFWAYLSQQIQHAPVYVPKALQPVPAKTRQLKKSEALPTKTGASKTKKLAQTIKSSEIKCPSCAKCKMAGKIFLLLSPLSGVLGSNKCREGDQGRRMDLSKINILGK
jgi:DNA topoisomerase I